MSVEQPEVSCAQTRLGELIERVADRVVRRGLATPAIFLLESGKPLSFAGSQLLVFFDPIVRLFLTVPDYQLFVQLLEDRDRVEQLICAIEAREESPGGRA